MRSKVQRFYNIVQNYINQILFIHIRYQSATIIIKAGCKNIYITHILCIWKSTTDEEKYLILGQLDKHLQIGFFSLWTKWCAWVKNLISTQRTIKSNNVLLDIMTPHLATVVEDTLVLLLDLSILSDFICRPIKSIVRLENVTSRLWKNSYQKWLFIVSSF